MDGEFLALTYDGRKVKSPGFFAPKTLQTMLLVALSKANGTAVDFKAKVGIKCVLNAKGVKDYEYYVETIGEPIAADLQMLGELFTSFAPALPAAESTPAPALPAGQPVPTTPAPAAAKRK